MAADYLKEIRTLQPEGPYFLGDYCFGGKVAFEMAQQLHAQGQKVALLALLDAYAPGYPKPSPWVQRGITLRIQYHMGNLRRLGPQERLNYVRTKGRIVKTRIETKVKKIARKLYLNKRGPSPRALRELQGTNRPAFNLYVPNVYPGKVVLFRPSEQPITVYHDPQMGWSGLAAGGLDVYEVAGPFGSIILEPHVRGMAEYLKACLQKARAADWEKKS
jgi:thioesterase domain-containing protein